MGATEVESFSSSLTRRRSNRARLVMLLAGILVLVAFSLVAVFFWKSASKPRPVETGPTPGEAKHNAETCSTSIGNGYCAKTCPQGQFVSGQCNGPADVKCCVSNRTPAPTTLAPTPSAVVSCSTPQGQGVCSSSCSSGVFLSGFCNGPASVKCCVPQRTPAPVTLTPAPSAVVSCSTPQGQGVCSSSCSSGVFLSGFCNGPASVKCCVPQRAPAPGPASASTCSTPQGTGVCTSSCTNGEWASGSFCRGADRCCIPSKNEFYTPPVPKPGSTPCKSPNNGFLGTCLAQRSSCTGAIFPGECPGNSICCVSETRPAKLNQKYDISYNDFKNFFSGLTGDRSRAFWPYFNEALNGIMTGNPSQREVCQRFAAFIAQSGHETLGLLYWEEIASGGAYEGNRVLGNTKRGDGVRYKGRGAIQITGRYNYKTCGKLIGFPLEEQPDLVNFPSLGFRTAVWFWNSRRLNRLATGNRQDFVQMTKIINGGTKGLEDRLNRWEAAKKALGCK